MASAQSIDTQNRNATSEQSYAPRPFQIRACDECKRQKMKCSAIVDYPDPCKRCQNRRQPCEFTGKPERAIKRRQKRKRSASEGNQVQDLAISPLLESAAAEAFRRRSIPSDQPFMQDKILDVNVKHKPQVLGRHSELFALFPLSNISTADSAAENVNSRNFHGIEVSATEIIETFSLFFTTYSRHLDSFLDPSLSPDQYFAESPLLFWTIVVIGSRQYTQNPTLLNTLGRPVLSLVWKSMMQTNENICPVIESLILLATWAFPLKTVFKDMTFALSGMAMNLAVQIGFHVPQYAQAFSLGVIDSSGVSFSKRMNLWTNCVLCHLRSAASLGYPPTHLELVKKILSVIDLPQYVGIETVFQLRLLNLSSQASAAVFERDDDTKIGDDYLRATLNMLEVEFGNLETELAKFQNQERLHFHIARLQIRVYYLSTATGHDFSVHMAMLYQDSIAVIEVCGKLQESMQLSLSCPTYIWLMLGLAACAILKILRSRASFLEEVISPSEGRQSYFAAIALLKRTSIELNDGPGRLAGALTQLWTSRRISEFTKPIETNSPFAQRQSRDRLAMSLFYETLQWYRAEFGGQAFLISLEPRDPGLPHSIIPKNGTSLSQNDDSFLSDEHFFFPLEDIDLEDPLFANWIPMTDDDFTAFSMSSS